MIVSRAGLATLWAFGSLIVVACQRSNVEPDASKASGGATSKPASPKPTRPPEPEMEQTGGAGPSAGSAACRRSGWSTISALGKECRSVCSPDSPSSIPQLVFKPREGWCKGCLLLETPWAAATPDDAVPGGLRAFGAGPEWLNLSAVLGGKQGAIIGIYDAALEPVTGYYVDSQQTEPCGRVASIKFSAEGELGAHLVKHVFETQRFFSGPAGGADELFADDPAFTWEPSVLAQRAINDMWFSQQYVAIDLSGSLWLGARDTGVALEVSALPGAPAGQYGYAVAMAGEDVFASRWLDGRQSYVVYSEGSLQPFLGDDDHDIRDLVTDGETIVWLEGRDAMRVPSGGLVFRHYALYKSAFTTKRAELAPEVLVAEVPPLSHLVLANGRVVGIYMIAPPVYRAGALVVDVASGATLHSELPNNYSWGFELFPAEQQLWGAVTPGPMVHFETVARIPYGEMTVGVPPATSASDDARQ